VAVDEREAHGAATGIAPTGRRAAALAAALAIVVLAAFAIAIVGGYREGWTWTGFADNGTLWAWLDLLVLPVALAVLPLWYTTHDAFRESWRVVAALAAVAAAVLLVGGYALDWAWTGFRGNTLWDWLHLMLVPFVLPAGITWVRTRAREA
jgi:hypothetical protein